MGKIIDITGQKFGYLTALYPTRVKGRFGWHCKCECGQEVDIESNNLRQGKIQSCGCKKNKIISEKIAKNIVGQKFNHLTVLEKTSQRQCGSIVWKCRCDCGNITYIPTSNLKNGHTKTCGKCNFRNDNIPKLKLIGQRFGHLTVLEYLGTNNNTSLWKCKCDCGNEISVVGWHLTKGIVKSCGCLKQSYGEEIIANLLDQYNISFVQQKTFETCRFPDTNSLARFDFFIQDKYLLEYDGEQHFLKDDEKRGFYTPDKIKTIKEHDDFKNQWCKDNNISLIRISYKQLNNLTINDLLLNKEALCGEQ